MFHRIYHYITYSIARFRFNKLLQSYQKIGKEWMLINDVWLPLYPKIGFDTLRWIINGSYEKGEIEILKHHLRSTDRVLEIGTGLGYITTYSALLIGSENVLSFEPNPDNAEIAAQVFIKNQVSPILENKLLGECADRISFPVNNREKLASSLYKPSVNNLIIDQISLNDIINEWKPTYLIMDIEGGEYEIFRIIDFQTVKKVQFEIHPELLGQDRVNSIFNKLRISGFNKDDKSSSHPNYFFSR